MHKASRVPRYCCPTLPKERKTGDNHTRAWIRRCRGRPQSLAQRPERQQSPAEAGRTTLRCLQWRSDQKWEEENRIHNLATEEDREVFQSPESRGNWRPTEGTRTPELYLGTTSGRATNDQIERQETPQRDRRPANQPWKRQGGADARHSHRSSTHVVASPLKAACYILTHALNAETTAANLGYDRSN